MYTKSVFILWVAGVFAKLGYYFEYSFIYKMLSAIGKAATGSKILAGFVNDAPKDYAGGSFIFKPLLHVSGILMGGSKKLFGALSRANSTSINKKVFHIATAPLKNTEGIISAVCLVLGGIMPVVGVSQFGSALMVACTVLGVIFITCGVLLPEFLTTAFKGCLPARLIKWFFSE